jgi:hypothetical protein
MMYLFIRRFLAEVFKHLKCSKTYTIDHKPENETVDVKIYPINNQSKCVIDGT